MLWAFGLVWGLVFGGIILTLGPMFLDLMTDGKIDVVKKTEKIGLPMLYAGWVLLVVLGILMVFKCNVI